MGGALSYFLPNPKADWKEGVNSVERYIELARQDGLNLNPGDYELIQHVLHFLTDPAYPQLKSNFRASGLEATLKPIADLVKTSPKPKTEAEKRTPSIVPDYKSIAFSAPQWRWTHDECVTWIEACLVYYGGYPDLEANAFAVQFHGFGPVLLTITCEEWFGWLHHDGSCIRSILLETRYAEGGVPKCVYVTHEESKKEKDDARTRGREMRKNAFEMLGWKEEDHRPKFKEPIQSNWNDSLKKGGDEKECENHEYERKGHTRSHSKDSMKEDRNDYGYDSSAEKSEDVLQSGFGDGTMKEAQSVKDEQKVKWITLSNAERKKGRAVVLNHAQQKLARWIEDYRAREETQAAANNTQDSTALSDYTQEDVKDSEWEGITKGDT